MPALHVDEHLAGNVHWTSFIEVENKPGTFPKIDFINNPKPEQRADHVPHSYFFLKTCRNILRPTFTGLSLIQCPKPPKCDCNGIFLQIWTLRMKESLRQLIYCQLFWWFQTLVLKFAVRENETSSFSRLIKDCYFMIKQHENSRAH